jgi:hypothetical protein
MRYLKMLGMLLGVLLLSVAVTGCGGDKAEASPEIKMASASEMPRRVQQAPVTVQEAYRFAIANPDVLQEIPCYCGCGAMGHTSNYSCYAQGTVAEGTLRFDGHALGCSICVDITQDTMRLAGEGKTVADIKAYVDRRYSRFGPPTP